MKSRFHNAVRFLCATMVTGLLSMSFMMDVQASEFAIMYDSGKKSFVDDGLSTDILDFTDVMPGDILQETFLLGSLKPGKNPVRFFLRPKNNGEEGGLLAKCHIKLSVFGGEVLYDSEEHRESKLDEWILLGEYEPGESVELELSVVVPVDLTNEYMDQEGKIPFDFMAEDLEEPEKTSANTKTGDSANTVMWSIIAIVALCTSTGVFVYRRIKKN